MHAVSAETGQTVWKYEQRAATISLAATGGGLVFGGDVDGCFLELTPELRHGSWSDVRSGQGGGDQAAHEQWAGTLIPAGRTVP